MRPSLYSVPGWAAATLLYGTCLVLPMAAGQREPTQQRVVEIRRALLSHGYYAGESWPDVREKCREIARARGWQARRAPDARVLILLGLGNEHSDPEVLDSGPNRLDE